MDETADRVVCGMELGRVGVDIYDLDVYAFRAERWGAIPHTNVYTIGGEREDGRGKEKGGPSRADGLADVYSLYR